MRSLIVVLLICSANQAVEALKSAEFNFPLLTEDEKREWLYTEIESRFQLS